MPNIIEKILKNNWWVAKQHGSQGCIADSKVCLWNWDVKEDCITLDRNGLKMLGLPVADDRMSFDEWLKRIHPEDIQRVNQISQAFIEGSTYELEYRVRHEDGRWLWVRSHGGVVARNGDGMPTRVCGCHQNITSLKSSDVSLEKLKEDLSTVNRILFSIYEINHLIVEEKNRDHLLQKSCEILVENQSVLHCMMLASDSAGKLGSKIYQSGLAASDVDLMNRHLEEGLLPPCISHAMETDELTITEHPSSDCPDCPFRDKYGNSVGITVCLKHAGYRYGVLAVAAPPSFAKDKQGMELLRKIGDDLAFALHEIEGEQHKQGLHTIVNAVHNPVSMVSTEGLYLSVNNAYAELYGIPAKDIVGKSVVDLIGESRYEKEVKPYFDRVKAGEVVRYENQARFPITGLRWMQMEGIPFFSDHGSVSAVIFHGVDITESKSQKIRLEQANRDLQDARLAALNMMEDSILAQQKMEFQNQLFASFMDSMPANVFFKDIEGRLLSVNKHLAQFLEKSPEELVGKKADDFFSSEEAQHSAQADQHVLESGKVAEVEEFVAGRWWRTTKVPRLNASGKVEGLYGISWDITDRKKAEEQLELTQFAIDHSDAEILLIRPDYTFEYVNDAACRMLGYTRAELLELTALDIDVDFTNEMGNELWKQLKIEKSMLLECRQRRKDGGMFPAEIQLNYLENAGEKYVFVYAHDISDRAAARNRLEQSESKFRSYVENAPYGMFIMDTAGNYLDVNPAAEKMTGYSRAELLHMRVPDLYPNEPERTLATKAFESMVETGRLHVEVSFVKKTGERRWWAVSATKLPNDRYLGFTEDITRRIESDAALKRSEAQYSTLLSNLPGMAYLCDNDDNRTMRFISDGCFDITGYGQQDLMEHRTVSYNDLIHPDDKRSTYAQIQAGIEKSHHFEVEYRICTRDGKERWVWERGIGRVDEQGTAVLEGFISDITASKESEQDLEKSRRLLRAVIDTIPSRIWWKDGESHFLGANRVFAQDAGLASPDELLGKTDADMCWSEEADHFMADDRTVFETGKPRLNVEERQSTPEGTYRWIETSKVPLIDHSGKIIGTVGTYADITKRKEATDELKRLSTAIEQSPESIVITNAAGIIQYVNPAFEANTGYSREEAVGENPRLLKSDEYDEPFYETLWETISSGKVWEGQLVNKRKNGSLFTEEASISPVKDTNGEIINYVAIKRDITNELIREEEFRQSQKMEAIGLLAGGIAHDFNNILQAIIGFSDLLSLDLDEDSTGYQRVMKIQQSAAKAAGLTKQLLTFSRKKPAITCALNLNDTVHETESLIAILLGEKYRLELKLESDLPQIKADSGQLSQVIMNMAVNARDAMTEGGRLTVATELVRLDKNDAVMPDSRPGSFVCLSVADTGCGIDEHTRSRLFEPFFTTKEIGKGTGLGLSVVYGIVTQCKGWINVESKEGQGTTFKMYFPVVAVPADAEGPMDLDHDQLHILVVVDDPRIRTLVSEILESTRFRAIVVVSEAEAIDVFEQDPARFSLLVTNMILKDGSGLKLAERLRSLVPRLPVLFCGDSSVSLQGGGDLQKSSYCFIKKPFTSIELVTSIQKTILKSGMGQ